LLPGFAADLVILDTQRMLWPWAAPQSDPLELIVLRAERRDVRQVLIAGELVWDDAAPTRFDLPAAAAELAAQLQAADFPAHRLRAARAVEPQLRAWYGAWRQPPLRPWITYGSER